MKIFLSHSGARSRAVAAALNDWLKRVIQAVKPIYSPEIEKGAKWSSELDAALEGTRFGIICLTPDNLKSTWIHYEAGALSKTTDALIWTFLHGVNPGDVPQPLGKYQHTMTEKDDVLKLLRSINGRLAEVGGEPIDSALLAENFEFFWPQLAEKLQAAEEIIEHRATMAESEEVKRPRVEREILLEILEIVRSQQRPDSSPLESIDASEIKNVRRFILSLPEGEIVLSEHAHSIRRALDDRSYSLGATVTAKPESHRIYISLIAPISRSTLGELIAYLRQVNTLSSIYLLEIIKDQNNGR